MRYSEMVGLPGAGKTTALANVSRKDFQAFRTGRFVDRRTLVVRAEMGFLRPLMLTPSRLRGIINDSWGAGIMAQHAQLFSRVLQILELIPRGSRQREIILNYWRERLMRHVVISKLDSEKIGLTDEGLFQSLLSTVIRARGLEPDDAKSLSLVANVVEVLPTIDILYNFQVDRTTIEHRVSRSQVHWALSEKTEAWLFRLVLLARESGFGIRNIDASRSQLEIQCQLKESDL